MFWTEQINESKTRWDVSALRTICLLLKLGQVCLLKTKKSKVLLRLMRKKKGVLNLPRKLNCYWHHIDPVHKKRKKGENLWSVC